MRPTGTSVIALVVAVLLLGACGSPDRSRDAGTSAPIPTPVEIAVLGDFGDGGRGQYAIAETLRAEVRERDVRLLLTTGDNFYSDDVDVIWDTPYGWLEEEGIGVVAAWGNHDVETETRVSLVQEALQPPGRWYSTDLGAGRLIVLDSTQVDSAAQTSWLEDELGSSDEPAVVVFHHPAFSCGTHGSDESVQEQWMPLIEQHSVSLVLNGHEHNYQRFELDDTTYVVTGGGGATLTSMQTCSSETPEPVAFEDGVFHFLIMEVSDTAISVEAVAPGGEILDEFSVDY